MRWILIGVGWEAETSTRKFPECLFPRPSLAQSTCASVSLSWLRHPKQEGKMGRGTESSVRSQVESALCAKQDRTVMTTRAKDMNSTARKQPEARP